MKSKAKNAFLVLCLFVFYCVLLADVLHASALGTLFGALAALPLTTHVYRRIDSALTNSQQKTPNSEWVPVPRTRTAEPGVGQRSGRNGI